jgi:hypothetical protein
VKREAKTQDAVSIIRNTSPGVPRDRAEEMLTELSGYPEKYRSTKHQHLCPNCLGQYAGDGQVWRKASSDMKKGG